MRIHSFFRALVVAVLLIGPANWAVEADPDLPQPTSVMETIPSCSLVIPMDTLLQNSSGTFNVRAYGLAVHLLWNDIPLKWIIRSGKEYQGVDMTASAWTNMTASTSSNAQTFQFRAGPLVIPVTHAQYAIPLINAFNAGSTKPVKVFKLSQSVTAPVRYTLKKKPFVAVLNSSTNYYIQTAYLDLAGFNTSYYKVMTKEEANSISHDVCVSLCTEPHFEGPFDTISPASSFVDAMNTFVHSGGNFLAECGGIATYENCLTSYTVSKNSGAVTSSISCTNYFMTTGDVSGGFDVSKKSKPNNADVNVTHHHPDLAFFQFDGAWDQYVGGSVSNFDLYREPGFQTRLKDTAYWGVQWGSKNPADYSTAFHSAGVKLLPGRVGGNVWYVTGHDVAGFMPAMRSYLNAVLIPAERDVSCGFDVDECAWGGCGTYVKRADPVVTPCSCTDFCDASGLCGGQVNGICPMPSPPKASPTPVTRAPVAPRPPSSRTPGTSTTPAEPDPNAPVVQAAPGTSPIFANTPTASPVPIIDVNTTQGTEVIEADAGENKYFVFVVSKDVFTMQIWLQVLNWNPFVTVDVYLRRGGIPDPANNDYNCSMKGVRSLDFDYMSKDDQALYCKTPLPELAGEWVVMIHSPSATGIAFEGFLEPTYARTVEEVIYIGAAATNTTQITMALILALATILLAL